MKISQEAREAAQVLTTYLSIRGLKDGQIERSMQSLINSTLERARQHMEAAIAYGYDQPEGAQQCEHEKFRWDDCIACYDEALHKAASEMCRHAAD